MAAVRLCLLVLHACAFSTRSTSVSGSCTAAGFIGCCDGDDCFGEDGSCHCDQECFSAGDCCPDIEEIGCSPSSGSGSSGNVLGSCVAAGFIGCCDPDVFDDCLGSLEGVGAGFCSCDQECFSAGDCCPDIEEIGCSQSNEGFPDLNSAIAIRASQLTDVTGLVMYNDMLAVIPDLRFTCESGRITQWWIIGGVQNFGMPGSIVTPTFGIQNSDGTISTYAPSIDAVMLQDLLEISDRTGNRFLYSFMDGTTEFSNGSFLRISHPSPSVFNFNLYYSPGNGPNGIFMSSGDQDETFNSRDDYPLIAVQTDPPGCASGFLDVAYLESLVASVTPFHNQQRIIPEMNFSCSGSLTGLTVGALFIDTPAGEAIPAELQLWRCRNRESIPRICEGRTRIPIIEDGLAVVQPNVYSISLEPAIPVEPGDFLGVFQPSRDISQSIVYYARQEGPRNVRLNPPQESILEPELLERVMDSTDQDLPLVAVSIDGPEDCANGFIDEERLIDRSLLIDGTSSFNGDQQLVFPSVRFTTDGILTKWTFAARINNGQAQGVWPELQIWREVSSPTPVSGYEKITSSVLVDPPLLLGYLNVYTCTPVSPLAFQAGDILGVFQPRESRLSLASIADSGSMALTVATDQSLETLTSDTSAIQSLPLVAVEVRETQDATASDIPTTESTGRMQVGADDVPVATVVGTVVGVILVLLILTALVIVVIVTIYHKKKRRKVANDSTATGTFNGNPVSNNTIEHDYTYATAVTTDQIDEANYDYPFQQENYDYPFQHQNTTISTKPNEAYAVTITTDRNEAHYTTRVPNAANATRTDHEISGEYDYI